MSEDKIYSRFHALGDRSGILFSRFENGTVQIGCPDVAFVYNGGHGYCELKATNFKWTKSYVVPFRPGQYSWIRKRLNIYPSFPVWLVVCNAGLLYFIKGVAIKPEYYDEREMNNAAKVVIPFTSLTSKHIQVFKE